MNLPDQEKAVTRVLHALDAIRKGDMVIMVDEEDRENEGDIVFAAQHVSPEKINFMSREARGLICLALDPVFINRLELPMMRDVGKAASVKETAFTVSIEARHGVTTGISAHDRAQTIRVAVDEKATPQDLVVPGHIFPLKARSGGVLERAGHTEGSVDLARLAGCSAAAVICEIMNEDGSMARMPDLEKLAAKFNLPVLTIPDLIQYRLMQESLVELEAKTVAKTPYGIFDAYVFKAKLDGARHYAFTKGDNFSDHIVDVRVHMQRPLADLFGGENGRLPQRLEKGFGFLQDTPSGAFVYLTRPQTSNEMLREFDELRVDRLDQKLDDANSPNMDQRQVGLGAQILRNLGIKKMRILTTSNKSYIGLSGFGLEVVDHLRI